MCHLRCLPLCLLDRWVPPPLDLHLLDCLALALVASSSSSLTQSVSPTLATTWMVAYDASTARVFYSRDPLEEVVCYKLDLRTMSPKFLYPRRRQDRGIKKAELGRCRSRPSCTVTCVESCLRALGYIEPRSRGSTSVLRGCDRQVPPQTGFPAATAL